MSDWNTIPIFLMLLFTLAVSLSVGIVLAVIRHSGYSSPRGQPAPVPIKIAPPTLDQVGYYARPACWLCVKTQNLAAVQAALNLDNPKPCSMLQGLAAEEKLFIAPPVKGWVLVIGSALPDPADDVDKFYRFITSLSARLGQVQFFCANRVLFHHAWVWADRGRIVRAYSWAGRVLWTQGGPTAAEKDLDLRCFDYGEEPDGTETATSEIVGGNVDKVPVLAARWSLDPGRIEEGLVHQVCGIAGEPARRL